MENSVKFPHLLKAAIFEGLEPDFKTAFLNACSEKIFQSETIVLEQGEPSVGMIIVAHGYVDVTYVGEDGRQLFLVRSRAGSVLGEVEAISDGPCAATCTTSKQAILLFCYKPQLIEALRSLGFIKNITKIFHQRRVKDNLLKHIRQFGSVETRLRSHLFILSETGRKVGETQSYLAAVVGCSRQTINRELSKLRQAQIIRQEGNEIIVLDRAALQKDTGL